VIIPAYFAHAADITSLKDEWRDCRFESVQVLQASSRDVSHQPGFADPIRKATSVWFSGGEQSWLANLYSETELETRLQELLDRGGIIGGTSAGAAIMSRTMIEEGHREPKLRRGLDLFKDAVIDQHFFKRNRMQRMSKTLIRRPHLMGFGIDEGTALFVQVSSGRLGIIGNSYVMACIPESDTGSLRLEVLKAGDSFDIDQLRGLSDASASTELTSETVDLDDSYPT
jgi:cyanophycinase